LKKIGLFGGTFNPIHIGHLNVAKTVYDDFKLDKLYFIPSKIPPHKNLGPTTPKQRLEMVKLAVKNLEGNFIVSDYEIKKKGVSYTYLTLKYFRKRYRDDILFFITGTDIFATIDTWNNWEKLFELSNFIVVNRKELSFIDLFNIIPGKLLKIVRNIDTFENVKSGRIIIHRAKEIDISSTYIRDLIKTKEMKKFLPENVLNYIEKNEIYKGV
jgi:nicotinate-nucleotide adenylyltransferase